MFSKSKICRGPLFTCSRVNLDLGLTVHVSLERRKPNAMVPDTVVTTKHSVSLIFLDVFMAWQRLCQHRVRQSLDILFNFGC